MLLWKATFHQGGTQMSTPESEKESLDPSDLLVQRPDFSQQIMNVLNEIQQKKGYIPRADLQELATSSGRSEAELHALVSFFDSFRTRPTGKHQLHVCYGTACYARGANLIFDRLAKSLNLDEDATSPDGYVSVKKVYCVGACSQAPVIIEDGKMKSYVKSHQVPFILDKLRGNK